MRIEEGHIQFESLYMALFRKRILMRPDGR